MLENLVKTSYKAMPVNDYCKPCGKFSGRPRSQETRALSSSSLWHFFSSFFLYLIIESELDLDREKGESPLLELFFAQMMSVMC